MFAVVRVKGRFKHVSNMVAAGSTIALSRKKALTKHSVGHFLARAPGHSWKWRPESQASSSTYPKNLFGLVVNLERVFFGV